jgi:hypothetical protein
MLGNLDERCAMVEQHHDPLRLQDPAATRERRRTSPSTQHQQGGAGEDHAGLGGSTRRTAMMPATDPASRGGAPRSGRWTSWVTRTR